MKNILKILLLIIGINTSFYAYSQVNDSTIVDDNFIINDSTIIDNNFVTNDSLLIVNDTIITTDTIPTTDTIIPPIKKGGDPIDAIIMYECTDSMMLSMKDQLIFMYGKGQITTAGIELKSELIEIDMDKNELYAKGREDDSTKKVIGKPQFSEGDQKFSAGTMRYNFKTKNGVVTDVMTEQGDGFLHGDSTKLHANKEIHIKHGKYTTCDSEHPHFYIALSKAKVIPKKNIITGPFHFVIADVHLPIGLPFGFFPNSQEHSSGILLPTYATEATRGLGLVNGGYYFAISDYYDLELRGDFYTKGSYGVRMNTKFKKRYKYSGSANINYNHVITGEKILTDSKVSNTMGILLNYNEDTKFHPTSNFSANINLSQGNNGQYEAKDLNEFVTSTRSSSISYRKNFRGTPFNMSVNANATQNTRDSTIDLKLPTIAVNMRKLYIFKSRTKPAKNVWYEKIGVSFTSNFQNKVSSSDSLIFGIHKKENQELLFEKMQNGFKYDIPLSTSFKVLKYINVSPSFNYHGKIYPNHIEKHFYEDTDSLVTNTIYGFHHTQDFSFSIPLSTKIYGVFNINKGRVKAMRHVLSPTVGYSYKPDFSNDIWGVYKEDPSDSTGVTMYSIYKNGIFGSPGKGEQQNINFGLGNNFELKIKPKKNDTIGDDKKIKILDRLSINSSYNFAADSMNLSVFKLNASTRLFKKTSVSFSSSLDPYAINSEGGRINVFEYTENNNLARFTNARLTMSSGFSSKEFKQMRNKNTEKTDKKPNTKPSNDDPYGYYDATWSVKANYSLNYNRKFNTELQDYKINVTQNLTGSLNFVPTKKWAVSVSSGYDFDAMQLTSTTINMSRDLHCWEMNLTATPYGKMKSYLFSIRIKSSIFTGVEYKRQTSWHDNF